MTTYRNGLIHGGGIFIDEKYQGEKHVHGYNYLGPFTRTDIRLDENYKPRAGEAPINSLDTISMRHDIEYAKTKKEYQQDNNKQKALNRIHNSDREFIKEASKEGALGKVASGVMFAKMKAEENGIIDSKTFSGMGNNKIAFTTKTGKVVAFTKKHDPTARLKKLAGIAPTKKEKSKKVGGFAFLAPILASVAGALAGKLFDAVKSKIEGNGYKIDPELYRTDEHKRAFLKRVLN